VNRDIVTLAQHLIGVVRADIRSHRTGETDRDAPLFRVVGVE
jgi:hypothetical protein